MKIHGVGPVVADKWYNQGMRTLVDIGNRTDLTDPQKIGLEFFVDFNNRIPRAEVAELSEMYARVAYVVLRQSAKRSTRSSSPSPSGLTVVAYLHVVT